MAHRTGSWGGARGTAALALLLVAVAAAAALVNTTLINLLGLVVIGSALLLSMSATAALSGAALVLAALVADSEDTTRGWLRLMNLALACLLALAVSAAMRARLRRLEASARRETDVLAALAEGVIVLDSHGVLKVVNDGMRVLVPAARKGLQLHPLIGHVRADGSTCPGGCALAGARPATFDRVPVEGEALTRAGRAVPIAYTVGAYGDSDIVVTLRDVSVRIAAQEDREVLLESAARADEQAHLVHVLGGSGTRTTTIHGIDADVWAPGADDGGLASGGLTSLTPLADEGCLLLMVDALSDGLEAVREAWKVLYVCRAHLVAGAPLAEMISRAADSLAVDGERPAATIVGVILDPITGLVQVASGGHPAPLLVPHDGRSSWVAAPGHALGNGAAGSAGVASALLGPGDSLVVFGHGMVDASGDAVGGTSTLRSVATQLRPTQIHGLAQRIGESVVPAGGARHRAGSLVVLRLSAA